MSNKLTEMARQILCIESDLPHRLNYAMSRPTIDDFEFYQFEQAWADTTTGFGGIGGQAITIENTYVFVPLLDDQKCHVYFGGRFAYSVPYSGVFMDDVRRCIMASVAQSGKYQKAVQNEAT